jgi:hypothetical protein
MEEKRKAQPAKIKIMGYGISVVLSALFIAGFAFYLSCSGSNHQKA